jgi:hypothetical protein
VPVRIDGEVWELWRERAELVKEPRIDLRFVSDSPRDQALRALREALATALAALDPGTELPDGYDEPRVGECRIAAGADAVVLQIYDSDMIEALLGKIVADLEARGLDGRLEPYQPPVLPPPPNVMPLVECRMRPRGERQHIRSWAHRWIAHPDPFERLVMAGAGWCSALPAISSTNLSIDTLPRVAVNPFDDLPELLRGVIEQTGVVADLTCSGGDRYRTMAICPRDGRITLIDAGEAIGGVHGWLAPAGELTEFLSENIRELVYAYIKHGSSWALAVHAESLQFDWPPSPYTRWIGTRQEPFEDVYAPDAFAVQLLGPGYAGRIPTTTCWRQTQLENDSVLLEHTDPTAWFDTPFAPYGGVNQTPAFEPPPVLLRARADLDPILFRDEIAVQHQSSGSAPLGHGGWSG